MSRLILFAVFLFGIALPAQAAPPGIEPVYWGEDTLSRWLGEARKLLDRSPSRSEETEDAMEAGPAAMPRWKVSRTEAEWRKLLTYGQFRILRQNRTELARSPGLFHSTADFNSLSRRN